MAETRVSVAFDMLVRIATGVIRERTGKEDWVCNILAHTVVSKFLAECGMQKATLSEQADMLTALSV